MPIASKMPGWIHVSGSKRTGNAIWRHIATGWEVRSAGCKWEAFPPGSPFPYSAAPFEFFSDAIEAVERRVRNTPNPAEPVL
jgi:hypothetical protein